MPFSTSRWKAEPKLTFVEEKNNLVKRLEKVHVLIAILLNLVEQNDLRLCCSCKSREQSGVLLQMTQSLVLKQVLFLVPFNGRHHAGPNLISKEKSLDAIHVNMQSSISYKFQVIRSIFHWRKSHIRKFILFFWNW